MSLEWTLDKMIRKMIRNVARSIAMDQDFDHSPNKEVVEKVLGAPKFDRDRSTSNSGCWCSYGISMDICWW